MFSYFILFQFSSLLSQDIETTLQEIADDYGVMGMSLYVNVNGAVSETYIGLRDFTKKPFQSTRILNIVLHRYLSHLHP